MNDDDSTTGPAEPFELADLVSIDLESELRKISSSTLQGSWQLPAEWVQRTFSQGAREVAVRIFADRFELTWRDAPLGETQLRALAALVDPTQAPQDRHEALVALERAGETAMVATAGAILARARLTTAHGDRGIQFVFQDGRASIEHTPQLPESNTLSIMLSPFDAPRARAWLRSSGRHARTFGRALVLDGTEILDLHASPMALPLEGPLRGHVMVPRDLDRGHIAVVKDGFITAHLSINAAPVFDAVIDISPEANSETGSALDADGARNLVAGHLDQLREAYLSLLRQAMRTPEKWTEPLRGILTVSLLHSARQSAGLAAIETRPFLRAVARRGDASRPEGENQIKWMWLSLADIRGLAFEGGNVLAALDSRQPVDSYLLGEAPTLVADEAARALLAEILDISFSVPPTRRAAPSLAAALRRVIRSTIDVLPLLARPFSPRPLADQDLRDEEAKLLRSLRDLGGEEPWQIRFAQGSGPIRKGAADIVLLPRENTLVRKAVAAFSRDPAWLYPVAVMLLRPQSVPPTGLTAARNDWRLRWQVER